MPLQATVSGRESQAPRRLFHSGSEKQKRRTARSEGRNHDVFARACQHRFPAPAGCPRSKSLLLLKIKRGPTAPPAPCARGENANRAVSLKRRLKVWRPPPPRGAAPPRAPSRRPSDSFPITPLGPEQKQNTHRKAKREKKPQTKLLSHSFFPTAQRAPCKAPCVRGSPRCP